MGDGKVALILDVPGVGQRSGVLSEARDQSRSEAAKSDTARSERQAFLLFRAGEFERLAVPLSLVARLEEFPSSRIERAGGNGSCSHRDRILQLTPLASVLGGYRETKCPATRRKSSYLRRAREWPASSSTRFSISHDETLRIGTGSNQARLSGSAVLGGKVTDFLDLLAVLRAADSNWVTDPVKMHVDPAPVLVADPSAFSRGLIRNYLELAGYKVVEAVTVDEALDKLDRGNMGAVITAAAGPVRSGNWSRRCGGVRAWRRRRSSI